MAIKEFAAKQVAKQVLPLVGKMSDKDSGKLLLLAKKLAPNGFTRSFIEAIDGYRQEQHPIVELIRRAIRQTSPQVRERIVNSILIKQHWAGGLIRDEWRKQGIAVPGCFLISLTTRCNLRCKGCFAANYAKGVDLPLDVIDRVLTEGEELGIFWVNILGGEPFIRDDMWDIYERHSDVFFQIYTNGTLIDKEAARRLARLGNALVTFSIEGFEEETDARRGRGTFQKIMQGMDNLREVGVPIGFSATVTRHNIDVLTNDKFYDMLIDKGCLLGWHFFYMPVGRNASTELMPTPEQRKLMQHLGAKRIRNQKPLFVIDFLNDGPYMNGCIAGARHYFHINAHGDVEPCVFVHLAVDNVKQKSLKEIISSPFFKAIRARQPFDNNRLRPCMIIDHPHVLREVYNGFHPRSTDGPTCGLVTTLADDLDRYSQDVAKLMNPVWEEEYARWHFVPDKFAPGKVNEPESMVKPI